MKIRTAIAILSLTLIINPSRLYAQFFYRFADLRIYFLVPRNGDIYNSPANIDVQIQVVNQGPDNIYPTDTFYYQIATQLLPRQPKRKVTFPNGLNVNDSFIVTLPIRVDTNRSYPRTGFGFSNAPICYGPATENYGQLFQETSETWGDNWNNSVVVSYYWRAANINPLEDTEPIRAYPNPSSDQIVRLNKVLQEDAIECFDITGKQIVFSTVAVSRSGTLLKVKACHGQLVFIRVRENGYVQTVKVVFL